MNSEGQQRQIDLNGVPETMLWPLWNRAHAESSKNPLIKDELSRSLVETLDYDFEGNFGKPNPGHLVRARFSDDLIKDYCRRHPDGVVIALGEGLETQLWRIDSAQTNWYSVDLAESIAVRRQLLPAHKRNILISKSALDYSWMDDIQHTGPVFISAAGLLMYFERHEVVDLLKQIASRFEKSELFFDVIPPWISKKTLKGLNITKSYTAPPMPFSLPLIDLPKFSADVGGLTVHQALTYAEPFPEQMRFFYYLSKISWCRNNIAPALIVAQFG